MIGLAVDAWAFAVALLALGVSVFALVYTGRQASAARAANAPDVTLEAFRNDAIGSVTVALRCKANIKKAVVQVRPNSSAVALENLDDPTHPAPGPAIVLTDISSGAPIKLRASYEGEKRPVRLSIVVHGSGFGKQVLNVEAEPSFPSLGHSRSPNRIDLRTSVGG